MKDCKFEYIDKAALNQDEKAAKTTRHQTLAKALIDSKISYWNEGKLIVYPSMKREAEDFIRYSLDASNEAFLYPVEKVDSKGKTNIIAYRVRINVLNDSSGVTEDMELDKAFYENMFNTNILQSIANEMEDEVEEHEEVFTGIFDSIKQKLTTYLNVFEDLSDDYEIGDRKSDIKRIVGQLSSAEFYKKMLGFSSYVVRSVNKVDHLSKKLMGTKDKKFLGVKERLANLPTNSEDKKIELRSIANLLEQGRSFYHMFDELETINQELIKLPQYASLQPRALDNYDREKLGISLEDLFTKYALTEEQKEEILTNLAVKNANGVWEGFLDSDAKLYEAINERTDLDIKNLFDDVRNTLSKSKKKYPPIFSQLQEALKKRTSLQLEFNELFLDVAVSIYYPEYLKGFKTEEFKYTEEQFRNLLQNADQDSSFLAGWLGAAVDSSDQLLAFTTAFLKRNLNDLYMTKTENANNMADVLEATGFDKKSKEEAQVSFDKMQYKTKTLKTDNFDALQIIDDVTELDSSTYITTNYFGTPVHFAANPDELIYSEYDEARYNAESRTFYHLLDKQVHDVVQKLKLRNDDGSVISVEDFYAELKTLVPNIPNLEKMVTAYINKEKVLTPEIYDAIVNFNYSGIRNIVKAIYQIDFNSARWQLKSQLEIEQEQKSLGLLNIDFSQEGTKLTNLRERKNFKKNVSSNEIKWYGETTSSLGYTIKNKFDRLFGKNHKFLIEGDTTIESKEILVQTTDGKYKWMKVEKITNRNAVGEEYSYANFPEGGTENVAKFHTYKGVFQTFTDAYKLPLPNFTKQEKQMFDFIKIMVKDARTKFGNAAALTPYITYRDEQSFWSKAVKNPKGTIRGFVKEVIDLKPEPDSYPLMKNGINVDFNGKPVKTPIYVSRKQYDLSSKTIHTIKANYNNFVPVEQRNRNLAEVALLYSNEATTYSKQREMLPQINLLRTIVEGDEKAKISTNGAVLGRKTRAKNNLGKMLFGKQGQQEVVKAEKLNKQLNNVVNQLFYMEAEADKVWDLGITQISANKLSRKISGFQNLQVMLWNVSTMLPNFSIATIQMRSQAVMELYYTVSDFNKSFLDVFRNRIPTFFSDITKLRNKDKSLLAQIAIRYNAIQGEVMDAHGIVHKDDLANKFFSNATFFNQNTIEFLNQILTMQMVMRGFKLPTGGSLWDAIDPTWKAGEEFRYSPAIVAQISNFKEIELDFMARLQKINRDLHGAYAKEDKNELQRLWYGRLMMMYKKYLYPSYRSRFTEMQHSFELKDVEEGYVRTYFKEIFKEFRGLAEQKTLVEGLVESGWKKSLLTFGKGMAKINLAALDAASFRLLSKNVKSVDDYLYGETLDERKRKAMMRATWEMGALIQWMILTYVLSALADGADDDSVEQKVLQTLEINAFRMQSDLGMYLPFVLAPLAQGSLPGGYTIDSATRIYKDPFTTVRMIDQTSGFFHQLIGVDITEDGLDFAFNDVYDRAGYGYEKGDSKLLHKGYRVFLSPYWQMIKMMSPEEQLQYMELLNKNSR
jgi:hypothetical protein